MKKAFLFLFTVGLLLSACGNKEAFTLKGNMEGLSSDTILVYYQEPHYKLDTLFASNGTFTYTITPDTLTIFSLLLEGQAPLPIFANKGEEVTISGTADRPQIQGKGENARMAAILAYLNPLEGTHQDKTSAIDSILRSAPQSYTNLYLIDRYYVQDTLPDYEHINQLIKGMGGIIKDTPYIIELQDKLDRLTNAPTRQSVSNITCTDKQGKTISWGQVKNQYVLLNFWASWDSLSVAAQDSLVTVQKALKKEKFTIISLSLDLDRDAWLAACHRDTTQWKQVCDFKDWDNTIVSQQHINRLPSNLLLGPDRKIIARDIRGKELIDKVKELIKQDKEKEKAAKEAERKRKRTNRK